MENKDDIIGCYSLLCDCFSDYKKAYLSQPNLSKDTLKAHLKKTIYNALFKNMRGPHNATVVPNGEDQSAELDMLGCIVKMRSYGRYDDANRLQSLSETFFTEDLDTKHNVIRFLLKLSQIHSNEDKNILGHNVFKPAFLKVDESCILPEGPRCYGDSRIPRPDGKTYFMHFPNHVFLSHGVNTNNYGTKYTHDHSTKYIDSDIFSQAPGTGLSFIFKPGTGKTDYEKQNQSSLFGALVHSSSSSLDTKLDIPDLSENNNFNGFQIPKCFDINGDEGYESTISSTPLSDIASDSGRGSADLWEKALTECPQKRLTWELVGKAVFSKEKPFVTEAANIFDKLYQVHMNMLSLFNPSHKPSVPCFISMKKLVKDSLFLLMGIPSTSFEYDCINSVFTIKDGLCVSGLTPESMARLCRSLLSCGTHYVRLEQFAQPTHGESLQFKGLVFQSFTDGIRRYLQYYKGCVLCISHDKTLLEITCILRNVMMQINFLAELCGCAISERSLPGILRDGFFPTGIALLSYLYEECLQVSNSPLYQLMLSLLHSAARPYLLFLQDWVFQGIHRDVYGEFMIKVDENFLESRDVNYWKHGFCLSGIEKEVSVPVFLKELTSEVFVCGKSINLLRVISPYHFLLQTDKDLPSIRITFSEEDLSHIEARCRIYRSKMEEITHQLTISREKMLAMEEKKKQELVIIARKTAFQEVKRLQQQSRALRKEKDDKKRKLFSELRSQMEDQLNHRMLLKANEKKADAERVNNVAKQELLEARHSEELERQAKEEMIEYYARLTEEATKREQRALWHIRRHQLQPLREEYFRTQSLMEEAMVLNMPHDVIKDRSENLEIQFGNNEVENHEPNQDVTFQSLPNWAQEGMRTGTTKEVDDQGEACTKQESVLLAFTSDDNLPSWVNRTDKDSFNSDSLERKGHPSQSSIQSVLYQSEVAKRETKQVFMYASDKKHPSNTSTEGLLQMDSGKYIETLQRKNEDVTIEDLKNAELLHRQHVGEIPKIENQHPSSSVIQDLLYDSGLSSQTDLKNATCSQKGSNIELDEKDIKTTSQEKTSVQSDEMVSLSMPVKTHVKIDHNKHVTKESSEEISFRSSIKLVTEMTSSESKTKVETTHIKLVDGAHISKESEPAPEIKLHIKKVHDYDCTIESKPEPIKRKTLQTVEGKHVSDESKPNDQVLKSRVKFYPDLHSSNESEPKQNIIKKPSAFGHISELCTQEYEILAPKLKKMQQMHSSKESDWFSYQVKSCRKKVSGYEINDMSEKEREDKPKIRINPSSHVSKQSEPLNIDRYRMQKFKELNVFGHSSDSSAQKLLYGDSFGSGKYDSGGANESVPSSTDADNIHFIIDTEVVPYEDRFDMLSHAPQVDLIKGYYIANIDGSLCLPPEIDEDTSAHAFASLSSLLKRSITAPLTAQISLVNKNILNLFNGEFQIQKHFEVLRYFMLMQDGEFGQTLTDQLFEALSNGPTVHEFFNPVFLNSVLHKALQCSLQGEHVFASNISFMVSKVPKVLKHNSPDAFQGLEMTYKVDWPINIIITDECLDIYSKVFTFMLLLKRAVWSLKDIFYKMKRDGVVNRANNAQQYRIMQLYRHEMQHFVKVIQGYIANQVIHVSWQEFQDQLKNNVLDLDDLHDCHMSYLLSCQSRCLLNEKTRKVMQIIENVFSLILKFRVQLISDEWKKSEGGELEHPKFEQLCSTFKSFAEYSKFLFRVVDKLAIRGYQPHLKELVLRLNFNEHYIKSLS